MTCFRWIVSMHRRLKIDLIKETKEPNPIILTAGAAIMALSRSSLITKRN